MGRLDLADIDTESCTEVEPAVRSVLGLSSVQIERKSLRLQVTSDAWITVRVERSVLCDIVDNLLSNAIEASRHEGLIRISITQKSTAEVEMRVSDEGVGMKAQVAARIFERFFSQRSDGGGLGLWTVQAYVDALGGAVDVESVPGQGTTLRVVLPSAAPADREVSQ